MTSAPSVPSPCTGVCRIDARTGWCEGCRRSLDEIALWSSLSDEERRAVRQRLKLRRVDGSGASGVARRPV